MIISSNLGNGVTVHGKVSGAIGTVNEKINTVQQPTDID